MVINTLLTVALMFVLMYSTAFFVRAIGYGNDITMVVQTILSGLAAYALLHIGFISGWLVIAMVCTPSAVHIIDYILVRRQASRIRAGKEGKEAMWAAELVEAEDEEFIEASRHLPKMRIQEIGIVCESKDELRELTVEAYDEMDQND